MGTQAGFYTLDSLFTLSGSASAVLLITSLLNHFLGKNGAKASKWIALGLSLTFTIGGMFFANSTWWQNGQNYILIFVNCSLIYSTAILGNSFIAQKTVSMKSSLGSNEAKQGFTDSWF